MVNLLPTKQKRQLKRAYYLRLATTLAVLAHGALVVGGVLLIPSYVVAERAADSAERYLAAVEETVAVRERAGVSHTIRALSERLRILDTLAVQPRAVPALDVVLERRTSGIRITGIGFAKGNSDAIALSIAGTAANRTALLTFIDTLRAAGTLDGVEVPVSQLAQEANIPFSITATYRSRP